MTRLPFPFNAYFSCFLGNANMESLPLGQAGEWKSLTANQGWEGRRHR